MESPGRSPCECWMRLCLIVTEKQGPDGKNPIADGVSVVLEALLMIVCTWTGVVQIGQRQRPEEDSGKQLPSLPVGCFAPSFTALFCALCFPAHVSTISHLTKADEEGQARSHRGADL